MNQSQFSLSKVLLIIPIVLCFSSCKDKNDKGRYNQTVSICNNLYVEVYTTYAQGAWGSNLSDDYLTDSTNFRVRIGNFDDYNGGYHYKCNGDSILIEKSYKSDTSKVYKIIETNNYKIEVLKNLKNISNTTITNISKK